MVAGAVLVFGYAKLPTALAGVGRYTVAVQLSEAGGLYPRANVTYHGVEVGQVKEVKLTDHGAEATLSLNAGTSIPSDLDAQVHSVSAIGEQYVALIPREAASHPLKNGDLITQDRTSIPPDLSSLFDAANRGLEAIPQENLRTAVDEASIAVGGLGPEISRIVRGATTLASDSRANLDSLTALVDHSAPVLKTQADTSDAIARWAANAAVLSGQLRESDAAIRGILDHGPSAVAEATQLVDRLRPTLPVLLANLVGVGKVALSYHANLEQILVLLPGGVAGTQAALIPNLGAGPGRNGSFLNFVTNINLPRTCSTGFLPPQQQRSAANVDAPLRPSGDLYCRIPQDARFNVRGARNIPCATVPGKRAPTAAMCESDEQYVPLNDGYNWKGDPNATLSGQDIPQYSPGAVPTAAESTAATASPPPTAPPIAVAEYDPATGAYVGPDGRVYTQADLATNTPPSWQSMLMPATR